ncbi:MULTISPECIES: hypothetical protein [Pseudomonas]|uniref:hypothetical protein n=1 Tax=Pseudomonas TaxID=286 RepID=UPI002595985E|nr:MULTISPECIES: hypothetical protein [Pseudomonas]
MNIDWSEAPNDAIGAFYRFDESRRKLFFVRSKDFSTFQGRPGFKGHKAGEARDEGYHVFMEFWEFAERPAASKWNGPEDGLPPVGTVCELQDATEVRILAHTKRAGAPVAVYQCTDSESIEAYTASFFRPIRTPEQIAAEERDKAIKEMADDLGIMHTTAAQAYDKGYRKIES